MSAVALVAGAAGFIGTYVARELIGRGYTVFGIGHQGPKPPCIRGAFHWHAADVAAEPLHATCCLPDLVVHCAGGASVAMSLADPDADRLRTVGSTAAVLRYAAERAPAARLVLISSAATYGDAGHQPIDEFAALQPVSPYGRHKVEAEDLWRSHAARAGANCAIVRLFSVYGEGLRKQLLWDACRKLTQGDDMFGGTGDELRDWLHVSDAAMLLALVGQHASPDCPVVNGASGIATSTREILLGLASALGSPLRPRFSGTGRSGDPQRYWADIQRAGALGWRPRMEWQSGVARYAHWYMREST